MKFEEAFDKLNSIKEKLENPEITLDESIKLYEQSVEYTKICIDTLKSTEGKITVIKDQIDALTEEPLDVEE